MYSHLFFFVVVGIFIGCSFWNLTFWHHLFLPFKTHIENLLHSSHLTCRFILQVRKKKIEVNYSLHQSLKIFYGLLHLVLDLFVGITWNSSYYMIQSESCILGVSFSQIFLRKDGLSFFPGNQTKKLSSFLTTIFPFWANPTSTTQYSIRYLQFEQQGESKHIAHHYNSCHHFLCFWFAPPAC